MDDVQNEPNIEEDVSVEATDEQGDDDVEVEQVEADAAPEAEEDKVTFDERQQAIMDKAIGNKVAQTYKERQAREEAERRYQDLLAKQPKPEEPSVPEMPDPDDYYGDPEGYRTKVQQREEAIRQRTEFEVQNRLTREQQEHQARQRAYEEQQKQREVLDTYSNKAKEFGIAVDQMQKDATTVVQAGISQELSDYLLAEEQGPLLTNYLASNLLELDNVRQMSPVQAAVYIATEVRPKLKGVNKSTKAPPPTNIVDGGAVPAKTPDSIKGATFE